MAAPTLRPVRVVVVEAKQASRDVASQMLREAGFVVYPFETAHEALSCVLDEAPEVVVTGVASALSPLGGDALARLLADESPLVRAALLTAAADRVNETGLRLLFTRAQARGFEGARLVVGVARLAARCRPN